MNIDKGTTDQGFDSLCRNNSVNKNANSNPRLELGVMAKLQLQYREREILAHFDKSKLFCPIFMHFLVYFLGA